MSSLDFSNLNFNGLKCLQYPFIEQITNNQINNRFLYIQLICWLEDRKIRELEIEERDALRQDSSNWDANMAQYLIKLNCPFAWNNTAQQNIIKNLNWLITFSIRLEYNDCGKKLFYFLSLISII